MGSDEASKWSSVTVKVLIASCVAFVLVMFGSRFVTLKFGQVFPSTSQADHERIAALEKRIASLESRADTLTVKQDELTDEVASLKESRKLLVTAVSELIKRLNATTKTASPAPAKQQIRQEPADPGAGSTVHKGSPREKVREAFGRPESVSALEPFETWHYPNYKTVRFKDGAVDAWDGMPIEP